MDTKSKGKTKEQKKSKKPIWSYLINFERTEYIHFKIKPDFDIDNASNETIVKAMSHLYKTPRERMDSRKILKILPFFPVKIQENKRCFFNILLLPGGAEFYMSVPKEFSDLIEGKMKTIWNKAAITRVDPDRLNDFNYDDIEIGELIQKDYYFKSLDTNKQNLYPLTNMLGITKDLEEKHNEKVRISFSIDPVKRTDWVAKAEDEHKTYKKGKVVDREKKMLNEASSIVFKVLEMYVTFKIQIRMWILEAILGIFSSDEEENLSSQLKLESEENAKDEVKVNGLTSTTIYKKTAESFKSSINIMSQSKDKDRRGINMISVANTFKDITSDNELLLRKISDERGFFLLNKVVAMERRHTFENITNFRITPIVTRKGYYSDKEMGKFIQMPQKSLQEEYKLERIETREAEVPEDLLKGGIRIGKTENRGAEFETYYSNDKNAAATATVIVSPQGGGKTTFMKNFTHDSHKSGNANIVIEYLQNCEICTDLEKVIPAEDLVVINTHDETQIPALAYPEALSMITEESTPWEKLKIANILAHQVEYLINTVSDEKTGDLTVRMTRFLYSACMIVFTQPGTVVKDVFDCLRGFKRREEWVKKAMESNLFDPHDDVFYDMSELDRRNDKGKVIGTRDDLIAGILNRITMLSKDIYIKEMLKAPIDYTHNIIKYIEEGKTILIKIPESAFPDMKIRDVIATYWMTRIWLCVQIREQGSHNRICKIIFDEVANTPTLTDFIKNHIHEFRRHQLGAVFTVHFMEQFQTLFTGIRNTGMSLQILGGTGIDVLRMFEKEMRPFTLDDGLNLKRHQSLNVINYGNQYARFVTWLPPKPSWAV